MTLISNRKTRLRFETPYVSQHRAVIAQVEPWGLSLRLKGRRTWMPITWANIYNRAVMIAAERLREERHKHESSD